MPFNPSGIFSLVPSYLAVSGQTVRTEQHNPPLEDIALALSGVLVRDGRAPMVGDLNMNSFRITGLGDAVGATEPMTLGQLSAALSSTTALAATKANPVAADYLPLFDSTASNGLRRLPWSDLAAKFATAAQGTDAREWTAETISQAEAEAGAATTRRAWTAQRVRQAINARVPEILAALSFGAVGTYAFAYRGPGATIIEGTNYAGSTLYPAGIVNTSAIPGDTIGSSGADYNTRGPSSLSGTWRAMSRQAADGGWASIGLFYRIA